MITLTTVEKDFIKLCKGHYKSKYPWQGEWTDTIIPLFVEYYGWNPEEDNNYQDYLNCIFNKLLEIYLKIQDDRSGNNVEIRGIFEAAFHKGIVRTQNKAIERAIAELCGLIQNNTVVADGEQRYYL